jgi:hypothetical protein
VVNQDPYYLPTEAEIVDTKLTIQSEESAFQKVEEALIRGQGEYDASIIEADKLKAKEIAAICERFDTQVQRMTVSWEQQKAGLEAQMKKIEERLARQREFVAPVKWLPSEVLSEIFTIQVDCGDTPWTLLRVCRLWKAVAFSTPRIWRYIQIAENGKRFDSGTSFQSCFTKAQLEKALSRAGAAPLSISIALPGYNSNKVVDSKRLFAQFDTITKVLNRCDTLELKRTHRLFYKEDQELFATLQFPILSSLRCLHLEVGWENSSIAQKILAAINHESTALRELSIASDRDRSLVHSLAKYQLLLDRLTSFSAKGFEVPSDIFAAMRHLSFFSQEGCSIVPDQLPGASTLLQKAQFRSVKFLDCTTYQFGSLKRLALHTCSIPMQPGAIKVPVLDTLVFEGQSSSWLPILALDCPSLLHLELEGGPRSKGQANKELNQLWGSNTGLVHLKVLKINLVMSDATLVTILKKMAALELLSITIPDSGKPPTILGGTFFNSFLIKNSHRSGFLQSLRTLILRSKYRSSGEESLLQHLRTGIRRVVRSRRRVAPLWSAALHIVGWYGTETSREEFVECEEEQ